MKSLNLASLSVEYAYKFLSLPTMYCIRSLSTERFFRLAALPLVMTVTASLDGHSESQIQPWHTDVDIEGILLQICDKILSGEDFDARMKTATESERLPTLNGMAATISSTLIGRLASLRNPFKYVVQSSVYYVPSEVSSDSGLSCHIGHMSNIDHKTDSVMTFFWPKQRPSNAVDTHHISLPALHRIGCIVQILGMSAI